MSVSKNHSLPEEDFISIITTPSVILGKLENYNKLDFQHCKFLLPILYQAIEFNIGRSTFRNVKFTPSSADHPAKRDCQGDLVSFYYTIVLVLSQ